MYISCFVLALLCFCTSLFPVSFIFDLHLKYGFILLIQGFPYYSMGGMFSNGDSCFDAMDCSMQICQGNSGFVPIDNRSCSDGIDDYYDRLPMWMESEMKYFETYTWIVLIITISHSLSIPIFSLIYALLHYLSVSRKKLKCLSITAGVIVICLNITSCIGSILTNKSFDFYVPVFPMYLINMLDQQSISSMALLSLQMSIETLTISYTLIYMRDLEIDEYTPLTFTKEEICVNSLEKDMQERNSKIIVVDGNIASGKTSYINFLKKECKNRGLKVIMIPEPLNSWNEMGIFDAFDKDQDRWSYSFQTYAYCTRIMKAKEIFEQHDECDFYIMERSWFTDTIFMNNLHKNGKVTDMEMMMYREWCDMWSHILPFEPDHFIYVDCPPQMCLERKLVRGREEESSVSLKYLEDLETSHVDFFSSFDYEVQKIDNTQDYRSSDDLKKRKIDEFLSIVQ